MPGAYDFSDLMTSGDTHQENLVSSLGLSQYPIASIGAYLALGVAEHKYSDPKRFADIFGQMGAAQWSRAHAGRAGPSLHSARAGRWGPITPEYAQARGAARANRFMQAHGWKDTSEMMREMTAKHFDPSLRMSRMSGYAADKALYAGVERRFGKRFASRMMIGRAIGSISSAANMFFLAEVGGMVGGFVGNLIMNWRPAVGKPESRRTLETGGNWVDTRIAYTQRQRSIQAIHNSMLTSRAALGNEASFVHG